MLAIDHHLDNSQRNTLVKRKFVSVFSHDLSLSSAIMATKRVLFRELPDVSVLSSVYSFFKLTVEPAIDSTFVNQNLEL